MTLEIEDVDYQIRKKILLRSINLSFFPGSIYGLLGPNGAGKSTLFKIIAGLWQPTNGQILWQGSPLLKRPRCEVSRLVAFVPQNPLLTFDFTAYEMVAMGRYCHGKNQLKNIHAIKESLQKVNGWHLRDVPMGQLSGGERQRVYIARALATEAPIILLDEPTTHLDVRHQKEIWALLQDAASQGKIVVVSLHDLGAAQRFCHSIVILDQGQCMAQGPFEKAMTSSLLQTVFGLQPEDILLLPESWKFGLA